MPGQVPVYDKASEEYVNVVNDWSAKGGLPSEKRVATVPEVVEKLIELGFTVLVESGAGDAADFDDASYLAAAARIVFDSDALWSGADVVFKVRAPVR